MPKDLAENLELKIDKIRVQLIGATMRKLKNMSRRKVREFYEQEEKLS